MRLRLAGIALFLPVPVVLVLFTRLPLGVATSLACGVALMLTHRLYARPWALARAERRCLWCAGGVRAGTSLALRDPFGAGAWTACSEAHASRLRSVFGWAARHARLLQVGVLGSLASFLLAVPLASWLTSHPTAAQADASALFRLAIALTVLPFALLAPRAAPDHGASLSVPFPVHIQALIGSAAVLWLLRLVGTLWLCLGLWHVATRLGLSALTGTHAIGHTRMATESAVTIAGSHPFSTGNDTCLVHNGSLSNHNRLRETLRRHGERFQTENDTEVAAAYLSWRVRSGDTLKEALEHSLDDLDGFYTFVVGTRDGFAVLRDPIACKPAVMAETDAWVGFGSEFRALAALPGIETARIWEPAPATVYAWSRS